MLNMLNNNSNHYSTDANIHDRSAAPAARSPRARASCCGPTCPRSPYALSLSLSLSLSFSLFLSMLYIYIYIYIYAHTYLTLC